MVCLHPNPSWLGEVEVAEELGRRGAVKRRRGGEMGEGELVGRGEVKRRRGGETGEGELGVKGGERKGGRGWERRREEVEEDGRGGERREELGLVERGREERR